MQAPLHNKILVVVDGSAQSLEAVRYISAFVDPERTECVLFHLGSGFPEVFWDMRSNPLYRSNKNRVMQWLADYQLSLGEFSEIAHKIFKDAGFPKDAITVKSQSKMTALLKDIAQESYQGYHAIVLGRSRLNCLKRLFRKSLCQSIPGRIRHLPTVVVNGKPISHKILLALDESPAAMRGVSVIGALAGQSDLEFNICNCLKKPPKMPANDPSADVSEAEVDWLAYRQDRFRPYMAEAHERLEEAGVPADRISDSFVVCEGHAIHKLIETIREKNFGTIVVGRRDNTGFFMPFWQKRFGDYLIRTLENSAIWVVN